MMTQKPIKPKFIVFLFLIPCVLVLLVFASNRADSYMGRDRQADWRGKAAERIENIRKDDLTINVRTKNGANATWADIHIRMRRHAFAFGSAVSAGRLIGKSPDSEKYREKVERLYNKVVFENDLKWDSWETGKDNSPGKNYQMQRTFAALKWLNDRDISVRGHYVSWGPIDGTPIYESLKDQPEIFRERMLGHIREKVPAVGDMVNEWDVLNHPVGWGLTLGGLYGTDVYVDICRLTRKLNSTARLYINETGILPSRKESARLRDEYEKLIRYLQEKDAPLDGIGFMGHFDKKTLTPPEELLKILDRFAVFGLPLQVTEFDVRFGKKGENGTLTPDELQLQADYTRDFMTAMFSHPAVEGIIMWGFWEGRHWYPSAALYRKDWSIKPNGQVWEDLVFKKWWTDVAGKTDNKGNLNTRGFLGDYEIEVKYKGQTKVVPVKLLKGGTKVRITLDQ